jgi:hypothetical protein
MSSCGASTSQSYTDRSQAVVFLNEATGDIGWHSLGQYTFDAGRTGSAMVAATGRGTVMADALKWVSVPRYNDGSRVTQVALQPQDGIVLLARCSAPDGASQPAKADTRPDPGPEQGQGGRP